jgi:YgiT-type zinc finger domain-containing protein
MCRNGKTQDGYSTVVFEREEMTLVFKQVPSQVCDNCGEEYVSSEINKKLLTQAENEYDRGVSVELLNFAA